MFPTENQPFLETKLETYGALELWLKTHWDLPEEIYRSLLHGKVRAPGETIEPLGPASTLVRILTILRQRRPNAEDQVQWLRTPHAAFENHTPLDLMRTSYEEMQWVAYTLSAPMDSSTNNSTDSPTATPESR